MCCSQAQSPLPVVTPPELRKRSKGSFSKKSWLKSWFHMGLATTMSWPAMRPAASLNLGLIMVSPRSIWALSMPWMMEFIRATA